MLTYRQDVTRTYGTRLIELYETYCVLYPRTKERGNRDLRGQDLLGERIRLWRRQRLSVTQPFFSCPAR